MIQIILNAFRHELSRTNINTGMTVIELKDTIATNEGLKELNLYVSFSTKRTIEYIDYIKGTPYGNTEVKGVSIYCNLDNSTELMNKIIDCINDYIKKDILLF